MNDILNKWKNGLNRTRKSTFGKIANLLGATEITSQTWDDLEALLIQADLGVNTALQLTETLQSQAKQDGWTKTETLKTNLFDALRSLLIDPAPLTPNPDGPTIILIVGVNGSGKTTSVAKLGKHFQDSGHSVLLAAADTFRAAAIDQLQSWGERLDLRVVSGTPGGDPGAVAYDSINSAIARNEDYLLIDTAGRLHTRYNLMEELKKVYNVTAKTLPSAPHAVWLVLDATTGQNALQQAKAFKETVNVTGIILAKLDSSARGGMVFSINAELGLPIQFVGLGESPEDLQPFNPDIFIDSILAEFE